MSDTDSNVGDPEGVLAAAKRKRRRAPEPKNESDIIMADTLLEGSKPPRIKEKEPPTRRRAKREVLVTAPGVPVEDEHQGSGWITRGVKAGLAGFGGAHAMGRRLGAWGMAALAAGLAVAVLTGASRVAVPDPAPVAGVRIVYLDGPRIPDRELFGLLRRFPGVGGLRAGKDESLDDLATWLSEQPVVREVAHVRLRHDEEGSRRTVEIRLGLREPYLPVMLATGVRAWLDSEGRILPGVLPPPGGPTRPVVRGVEGVDSGRVAEAIWMWQRLEGLLEPGLVSAIFLDELLGPTGQRGIVLVTAGGSRFIWGRPEDLKYGVDRERKTRGLQHAIRCQGDLSKIATINVRFNEPFFTIR